MNTGLSIFTTNNPLITELLKSPSLCKYSEFINKTIEQEMEKREEFYNKITEQDKAEFINGEVIMHSPVKYKHNVIGKLLLKLLDTYVQINDLGFVGYEKIMVTLTRNDYEPDLCFFTKDKSVDFTDNQMQFPTPDFVVEILSPTTESIDRKIKFEDYAVHGVKEYWIIDPDKEILEQYVLENGIYNLNLKSGNGIVSSIVINGFEIDIKAIFNEETNLKEFKKFL